MKYSFKGVVYGLVSLAFLLAGLVTLAFGTFAAVAGNVGTASATLTAGLVLLFAATIDRFEILKGWGVEAKTRALDATIERANVTLEQLRGLAELTCSSLVELSAAAGRYDSAPTINESYDHSRKIAATLQSMGSSPATIRGVLSPWSRASAIDAMNFLRLELLDPLTTVATEFKSERIGKDPSGREFADLNVKMEATGKWRSDLERAVDWESPESADHAIRIIRGFLSRAELIGPRVHAAIAPLLIPWIGRLEHLHATSDLDDRGAWFAIR